jgi:hypothetical protein
MVFVNIPMGEIYHNGYMYDYIYNVYVYNNFWNYSHNTADLQYMTYVVSFVLHFAHQLLQTVTIIDYAHLLYNKIVSNIDKPKKYLVLMKMVIS